MKMHENIHEDSILSSFFSVEERLSKSTVKVKISSEILEKTVSSKSTNFVKFCCFELS